MNVEYYRITFAPSMDIPPAIIAVEAGLMSVMEFDGRMTPEKIPADEPVSRENVALVFGWQQFLDGWDQFLDAGEESDQLCRLLPYVYDASRPLESLEAKYNPWGNGDHPLFPIDAWQTAAAEGATASSYWEWARYRLQLVMGTRSGEELVRIDDPHLQTAPVTQQVYSAVLAGYDPLEDDRDDRRMTLIVDSDLHASLPVIEKLLKGKVRRDPAFIPHEDATSGLRVHLRSGYQVHVESDLCRKQETSYVNGGDLAWCYRALESAVYLQLLATDRGLNAEQLDAIYNPDGRGEHPVYPRAEWAGAIKDHQTMDSYWEWTAGRIASQLQRLDRQAAFDSPSP